MEDHRDGDLLETEALKVPAVIVNGGGLDGITFEVRGSFLEGIQRHGWAAPQQTKDTPVDAGHGEVEPYAQDGECGGVSFGLVRRRQGEARHQLVVRGIDGEVCCESDRGCDDGMSVPRALLIYIECMHKVHIYDIM